jgi:peptidoglycan/LPS O-acetylase OafA/YrhL
MPRLSDFKGRDNNFNLIRMLAATLVIVTHAFGITGNSRHEPVLRLFGIGAGDVGVDVFFLLSGFLVSKSWAGKAWWEFAWARCTRIYPALAVSTVISVAVVGAFFCNLPMPQFLQSPGTLSYVAHNLTVLPGVGAQESLPWAFGLANPPFNVPLWTLPHELEMYLVLAMIGLAVGLRSGWVALVAAFGAVSVVLRETVGLHLVSLDSGRFLYFFFVGSLAFTLRARIILSGRLALLLSLFVAITLLAGAPLLLRDAALALALPYVVLWCAYVPAGVIRLWNRFGDYSYGTYIWAFPIQYCLFVMGIAAVPGRSFYLTMLLVLPVAVASWHLIERPALRLKPPQIGVPRVDKSVPGSAD